MRTTIFYENSFGIISQWTGEVLKIDGNYITIKFSPKKIFKFDLKVNSEFMIICKKKIKPIDCLNSKQYFEAYDENLRYKIVLQTEKNIQHYWNGTNLN